MVRSQRFTQRVNELVEEILDEYSAELLEPDPIDITYRLFMKIQTVPMYRRRYDELVAGQWYNQQPELTVNSRIGRAVKEIGELDNLDECKVPPDSPLKLIKHYKRHVRSRS